MCKILKSVTQEQHKSTIPLLNCDQPEFCWIFKNVDFQLWEETTNRPQTIWLYGPSECNIHQVSSHIVDQNLLKAQRTVLYYFCSSVASEQPLISHFVRGLLYQYICYLPTDKQKLIIGNFLRNLIKCICKEESAYYPEIERFEKHSEKWLEEAPTDALWASLMSILAKEPEGELLIVIDGLGKVQDEKGEFIKGIREFIDNLQQRVSNTKAFLTSRRQTDVIKALDGLPYIEYDKERRGSTCTSSHAVN